MRRGEDLAGRVVRGDRDAPRSRRTNVHSIADHGDHRSGPAVPPGSWQLDCPTSRNSRPEHWGVGRRWTGSARPRSNGVSVIDTPDLGYVDLGLPSMPAYAYTQPRRTASSPA